MDHIHVHTSCVSAVGHLRQVGLESRNLPAEQRCHLPGGEESRDRQRCRLPGGEELRDCQRCRLPGGEESRYSQRCHLPGGEESRYCQRCHLPGGGVTVLSEVTPPGG